MKTKLLGFILAGAVSVFCLGGCATPAARIKANPEAFARLSPEQQVLVQAGQIGLGFEPEAVKLALGDPDRTTVRTDADGETLIWHYATYEADGRILYTGYYHTGRRWGGWGPLYPYYMDFPHRQVRDRFTVEFERGRVSAITEDRTR